MASNSPFLSGYINGVALTTPTAPSLASNLNVFNKILSDYDTNKRANEKHPLELEYQRLMNNSQALANDKNEFELSGSKEWDKYTRDNYGIGSIVDSNLNNRNKTLATIDGMKVDNTNKQLAYDISNYSYNRAKDTDRSLDNWTLNQGHNGNFDSYSALMKLEDKISEAKNTQAYYNNLIALLNGSKSNSDIINNNFYSNPSGVITNSTKIPIEEPKSNLLRPKGDSRSIKYIPQVFEIFGEDTDAVLNIIDKESNWNSKAVNKSASKASGFGQILKSYIPNYMKQLGYQGSDDELYNQYMNDETAQLKAMKLHLDITKKGMQNRGVPVNKDTLRMAWFMGAGGVSKFYNRLKENPNDNAYESYGLDSGVVKENMNVFFKGGDKSKPRTNYEMMNFLTQGKDGSYEDYLVNKAHTPVSLEYLPELISDKPDQVENLDSSANLPRSEGERMDSATINRITNELLDLDNKPVDLVTAIMDEYDKTMQAIRQRNIDNGMDINDPDMDNIILNNPGNYQGSIAFPDGNGNIAIVPTIVANDTSNPIYKMTLEATDKSLNGGKGFAPIYLNDNNTTDDMVRAIRDKGFNGDIFRIGKEAFSNNPNVDKGLAYSMVRNKMNGINDGLNKRIAKINDIVEKRYVSQVNGDLEQIQKYKHEWNKGISKSLNYLFNSKETKEKEKFLEAFNNSKSNRRNQYALLAYSILPKINLSGKTELRNFITDFITDENVNIRELLDTGAFKPMKGEEDIFLRTLQSLTDIFLELSGDDPYQSIEDSEESFEHNLNEAYDPNYDENKGRKDLVVLAKTPEFVLEALNKFNKNRQEYDSNRIQDLLNPKEITYNSPLIRTYR